MIQFRALIPFLNSRTPAIKRDKIPARILTPMQSAQSCELFSLEPHTRNPSGQTFHGWETLGRTELNCESTRQSFVNALRRAANEQPGLYAGCFIPRHGLRFIQQSAVLDLVICFECMSMITYTDKGESEDVLVSDSPRQMFDDTLVRAGVRLARS